MALLESAVSAESRIAITRAPAVSTGRTGEVNESAT
jgi:hypothetical protein